MITTRRPVVPPNRSVQFAYLDGEFYWSDKGHMDVYHYLRRLGIPESNLDSIQWGEVLNESSDEVPEYRLVPLSVDFGKFDPTQHEEMLERLRAMFPDIHLDENPPWRIGKPIPTTWAGSFWYSPELDKLYVSQGHGEAIRAIKEDHNGLHPKNLIAGWILWNGALDFWGSDYYGDQLEEADVTRYKDRVQQLWEGKRFSLVDRYTARMSMAERTGDPELDELIEEFANEGRYFDEQRADGQRPGQDPSEAIPNWWDYDTDWEGFPITDVKDPTWSKGVCSIVSEAFIQFLRENGVYAEFVDFDDLERSDFGYGNAQGWGNMHCVVKVPRGGHTYLIDWTASQYPGYTEFPMVQKLDNGNWQREWTSKTATVAGAFVYVPDRDQIYFGPNHPEILAQMEVRQQPRDLNGHVYGWMWDDPLRAEIFSDFMEYDQNPEPNAVPQAIHKLEQDYPGIQVTVPPQDIMDEIRQTLDAESAWEHVAIDLPEIPEWEDDPNLEDSKDRVWDRLFGDELDYQGAPKFAEGENVVMKAYGDSGTVNAPPYYKDGQWWYYVNVYDADGPRGVEVWPEDDMQRPSSYDEPGQLTMKDLLGIPPEGENYYRTANEDEFETPYIPKFQEGEHVVFRGGQGQGEVIQVEWWEDDWWYRIRKSDGQIVFAPEAACLVPDDELAGWTLKDLGIPPEGEEYYRTSAYTQLPEPGVILRATLEPYEDDPGGIWDYVCIKQDELSITLAPCDVSGKLYNSYQIIIRKIEWPAWAEGYNVSLEGWNPEFNEKEQGVLNENPDYTDEFAQKWPDILPWDEAEQDYYRTARDYNLLNQMIDEVGRGYLNQNVPANHPAWTPDCPYCGSQDTYETDPATPFKYRCNNCGEYFGTRAYSSWTITAQDGTMEGMDISGASGMLNSQIGGSTAASTAMQALTQAGGQVFVVGGAVRDSLMGKAPKDIDMMVQGLEPEQIQQALEPLGRLDFTGAAFGVFRFRKGADEVEIALPRAERSTGSGHRDFEVNADPYMSPEEDLRRRDFTINAMAYHPASQNFLDPHGGMEDLKNRRLRLVNNTAFADDPLRIVRALVATARYGFEPDPQLLAAMHEQGSAIRHLPGERIQMEMDKLMSSPEPVAAMQMAEQTGVLDYIAPELSSTVGFSQYNPHHDLDVWEHTMQVLNKASTISNDPDVRLAALFHDSGKPDAFWQDPDAPEGGGGHFYKKRQDDGSFIGEDHEEVGGDLVYEFMNRLRYPRKRIERVEFLVRNHMFPYFDTPKGARKFLKRCNGDVKLAYDLLALREADASGKREGEMNEFDSSQVEKTRDLLTQVLENDEAISTKDLAIDGNDLIQMGMKPGPEIGKVLNRLLEEVIENPELNNREDLLRLVNNQ